MQDPKNRHLGTIAQLCRTISSQLQHIPTIGKKLVKQQYLLHMFHNMVNFSPLAAEIGPVVWGTPANFNALGFAFWQRYCTASSSGRQANCGVEQRTPPIFGTAAITLGIGPHCYFLATLNFLRQEFEIFEHSQQLVDIIDRQSKNKMHWHPVFQKVFRF